MAFKVPDSLAGSGGLTVEGVVEIDAFDNVSRFAEDVSIPVTVRKNSTGSDFTRNRLNFIEGTNITITVADDATDDEIDITIDSTGGGGLSPIADDTFLANISGSSAVPTAVALTTLAGDGLTGGADAILAVGASTSIIVSTNDIQRAALVGDITAAQNVNTTAFRSFAAKSVLANATNAGAVPSDLAGSAAFQHLRVNSANNALEWATLSSYASTSIIYNSNTFERAALTGAVAATQNSNATVFSGIRVNGSATTDRTNINFIAGTGVTLTPTDDAGSDEIEITIDATGVGLSAIADQRVLGNDSGSSAVPTAITVHQELDWINGAVAWVYDNVDDQVRIGNFLSKERTDQFTVSVWFATNTTSDSKMFSKLLAAGTNRGWQLFLLNGQVFFQLISDTGTLNLVQRRTNDTFNDGRLHCATAVYTGTSTAAGITLYIDGVAVATTASGASLSATTLSAANLQIGGFDTTASFGPGILMHASVWGDDLTALEAAELYGDGTPPDLTATSMAADLQGWWKLDADDTAAASGVVDASGAGHHGSSSGGIGPVAVTGSLITQGPNGWGMTFPHTSGFPLVTQGYGVTPAYKQISLAALPSIATDTFLANVTAASAVPTAHSLATFAGAGLTYTGVTGILAVGSSTSIVVNANDIQRAALSGAITAAANSNTTAFGALAAKSVLANATNASAVPAALAGSAAFQYLRVNSANTALEWAVLSLASFPTMAAGSFLANVTAGTAVPTAHDLATFAGAGLTYTNVTGIMAVGAGTGITVNANDVQLTTIADDTFMANVSGSAAVATGKTFTSLAGDSLSYDTTGHNIDYVGTTNEVNLNAITGAQGVVDVSAMVCGGRLTITAPTGAWSIDGFTAKAEGFWFVITVASTDFPGTIINSTTATTGIRNPGFVNFTCNRQMSGLVMYGAFGGGSQWLFIPGALDPAELGFQAKKPPEVCRWDDDFDYVVGSSFSGNIFTGRGVWYSFNAGSAGGSTAFLAGESGHPGIIRLTTHTVINNLQCIHRGSDTSVLPTFPWVIGTDIRECNVICRLDTGNDVGLFIGFSEDPSSFAITGVGNSHIMGFLHDTAGTLSDSSVHCITRESDGVATNTDSGVTPGSSWRKYTIRQYTVGTVEFLINDALVATHTTQVPDAEGMNFGISVITRSAAARTLDVDYVDFESHRLSRF